MEINNVYLGSTLELLPKIESGIADMILTSPPVEKDMYKSSIPLKEFWKQLVRICKPNAAMVFVCINPYAANLINSNKKMYRHEWCWVKNAGSNFAKMDVQPMREHELVIVFGKNKVNYYPIFIDRTEGGKKRIEKLVNYNTKTKNVNPSLHKKVSSKRPEERYPSSVLKYSRERGYHPQQKPMGLAEYLIKTYSKAEELIIDPCGNAGTFGLAAKRTGRKFINIETEKEYFDTANERVMEILF